MLDQLEYSYATRSVLGVFHGVTDAISANDIGHVAELLGISRDFALEEITFDRQKTICANDFLGDLVFWLTPAQPNSVLPSRNEERKHSFCVSLSRVTRDAFLVRVDQAIDRGDVV